MKKNSKTLRLRSKECALYCSLLLMSSCATTNIDVDSTVNVPENFTETTQQLGTSDVSKWWQTWSDPVLRDLIEQGLRHNRDLAAMRSTVTAAQTQAAVVKADLGPAIGMDTSGSLYKGRVDNPLNSVERQALGPLHSPLGNEHINPDGQYGRVGFAASWEPDIFGGKRSDADAAYYASMGVVEQLHGAQMLLATEIASQYFQIRSLQQQLASGKRTVAALKNLEEYAVGRFGTGEANFIAIQEAKSKLLAMQAQVATLQAQADAHQRLIAVLVGQTPQNFRLADSSVDVLTHLPLPPAGQTPLAVLTRRPDIRAQENMVKSASAKLASAKADLLPRFNMNFLLGTGTLSLDSDLPSLKGLGGLVSAGISLPIFTAGRISRNINASDARLQAALAKYDQSILKALAEVDTSYQLQHSLTQQNKLLDRSVSAAQKQARGADEIFRYGQTTLDTALRARVDAENLKVKQIQGRLAAANNLMNIYKALGGGWGEGYSEAE